MPATARQVDAHDRIGNRLAGGVVRRDLERRPPRRSAASGSPARRRASRPASPAPARPAGAPAPAQRDRDASDRRPAQHDAHDGTCYLHGNSLQCQWERSRTLMMPDTSGAATDHRVAAADSVCSLALRPQRRLAAHGPQTAQPRRSPTTHLLGVRRRRVRRPDSPHPIRPRRHRRRAHDARSASCPNEMEGPHGLAISPDGKYPLHDDRPRPAGRQALEVRARRDRPTSSSARASRSATFPRRSTSRPTVSTRCR